MNIVLVVEIGETCPKHEKPTCCNGVRIFDFDGW
jgi:hypothetical protein